MLNKFKTLWAYYFKPTSFVWWTGWLGIALGIITVTHSDSELIHVFGEVFAELVGTQASPAQLLLYGLTAFGLGARKGE